MLKSKLRAFCLPFLSTIALLVPNMGSATGFDRYNYMSDPYLPFLAYESRTAMLADFVGRFGDVYERVNDDALDQQVQAMVDEVYAGFKKLYPRFMANKAKPLFVIAKSDDGMDLTAYPPRKYKYAHKGLMIFTTGFINANVSKAVKLGVVAHEMSHLFLWHLDANVTPIAPSMTI